MNQIINKIKYDKKIFVWIYCTLTIAFFIGSITGMTYNGNTHEYTFLETIKYFFNSLVCVKLIVFSYFAGLILSKDSRFKNLN